MTKQGKRIAGGGEISPLGRSIESDQRGEFTEYCDRFDEQIPVPKNQFIQFYYSQHYTVAQFLRFVLSADMKFNYRNLLSG